MEKTEMLKLPVAANSQETVTFLQLYNRKNYILSHKDGWHVPLSYLLAR